MVGAAVGRRLRASSDGGRRQRQRGLDGGHAHGRHRAPGPAARPGRRVGRGSGCRARLVAQRRTGSGRLSRLSGRRSRVDRLAGRAVFCRPRPARGHLRVPSLGDRSGRPGERRVAAGHDDRRPDSAADLFPGSRRPGARRRRRADRGDGVQPGRLRCVASAGGLAGRRCRSAGQRRGAGRSRSSGGVEHRGTRRRGGVPATSRG